MVISLMFCTELFAQTNKDDLGSWGMLFNQTRFHDKWSVHSEVQFRSYNMAPNTEQLIVRGGLNFHYKPNAVLTAGYGYITNYTNDGDVFKPHIQEENRIWEQLILKNNVDRILLEHRYRFEQRWVETEQTSYYKNRIRYLLRITIPLNKKELVKNTLFTSFYDEVFLHLNNIPFDRNRLYGAIGFQFSTSANVQVGYMVQTVGSVSKQYFQLGISYNPDLRKKQ